MKYGLSVCFAVVFAAAGLVSCVSIQKGAPLDPQENAEVLGKVSASVVSYQILHIPDKDMALAEAQAALTAQAEKQYGKGVEVRDIDAAGSRTSLSGMVPFSPFIGNFQMLHATGLAVRPEPPPPPKTLWDFLIRGAEKPLDFRFGVMYEPFSYVGIGSSRADVQNHMDVTSFATYEIALTSKKYLKGLSFIMDLDLNDTLIGQVGGLALALGYKRLMLRVTTGDLSGSMDVVMTNDHVVNGVRKELMTGRFDGKYLDAGLSLKIAGPVNAGLLYTRWSYPTVMPWTYSREEFNGRVGGSGYALDSDAVFDLYGLALSLDTWRWYMEAEQRRRVKVGPWLNGAFTFGLAIQTVSDSAQNRLRDQYPNWPLEVDAEPQVGIFLDALGGVMAVIKAGKRGKIGVGAGAVYTARSTVTTHSARQYKEDKLILNASGGTFGKIGLAIKAGVSF